MGQLNMSDVQLKTSEQGKVVLDSDLLVRGLLKELMQQKIINTATYVKASEEVDR